MKIKFILVMLVAVLTTTFSYASFPVERTVVPVTSKVTTKETKKEILVSPAAAGSEKSQGVALLFWFFLGGLAAHRWYLGSPWYWNVLFIITLGGLAIWAIVDLIGILTGSYEPKNGSYKSSFF